MTAFAELPARAPGRPRVGLIWYECARRLSWLVARLCFGLRIRGAEHIPPAGPVVFVSNHQSFLDPVLCGVATGARPSRPMARESLFRFPPLGWLLRSLGVMPVRMDGGAMGALRAALEELGAGRAVTLFPEGTRSADGAVGEFRPGLSLLVRRGHAAIVPMAVAGAFEAWPRDRRLPRFRRPICIEIGEAWSAAEAGQRFAEDADGALADIRLRVSRLLERAASARAGGRPAEAIP